MAYQAKTMLLSSESVPRKVATCLETRGIVQFEDLVFFWSSLPNLKKELFMIFAF